MLVFLIYLPTIAFMPHMLYIFSLFYLILIKIIKKESFKIKLDNNIKIILLLIFFIVLNRIIFVSNHIYVGEKESILNFLIPGILFLPVMYLISKNLTRKDLNILLFLITIEAFITLIEFYVGKTTFFTGLNRFKIVDLAHSNELLYFFRPMGLSENSSILAGKLFIGLLILYFNRDKISSKLLKMLILLILIFALIASFNRTALVASGFFYSLVFFKFYLSKNKNIWGSISKIFVTFLIVFISGYIIYYFGDIILLQFDRGDSSDILTGRGAIWHSFLIFIQDHFLFGNGSYKLYLPFYHGGLSYAHAHNSFLEIIATNGIIISLLYFILILLNINRKNLLYISVFSLFSLTQYFIFWNISLQDIIFFYFLFNVKRRDFEYRKKI